MFARIVDAIRVELTDKNLSETKLAKELGISQASLTRILNGKQRMGRLIAERIIQNRPAWSDLLHDNGHHSDAPCSH